MNLILVTKTPIIEKIFALICKKLNVDLLIKDNLEIKNSVDLIVVDEDFVNDSFNSLKSHTKKLAAIVSEELPFDKSRDFIINRPFLPASLEELLSEQIEFIKDDEINKEQIENDINEEELISNYVDSLAEDIADTIEEDNDESIITIASLNNGGVLDNLELSKISDILHDNDGYDCNNVDENDWKDINEIIDDALIEVNEYEFELEEKNKATRLVLNNYNISELKPFLQKFDQDVIDRLSNGEDVDVILSLKVNK